MAQLRIFSCLAVVALLTFVSGCSGALPNAEALFKQVRQQHSIAGIGPPEVQSPGISSQTREAIDRLTKRGYLTPLMEQHLALIRAIAGTQLVGGNKVTLLQNGPAIYAAMHRAIASANNSVNLETFTFADDTVGRQFASWLIKCSQRGVRVNVIYDSVGSLDTPKSFFDHLRSNGISVVAFNPLTSTSSKVGHSVLHRDHRKLLVVDGRLAITGSANIANVYADRLPRISSDSDQVSRMFWRDTDIEIEGPAVTQCQRLFVDEWYRQTGTLLPTANYFPHLKAHGTDLVQVLGSTPDAGFSAIYYALLSAIRQAQHNVYIADAYFAPGRQFLDRLRSAGRRGINVELLLPHRTDHPIVLYAARWYYGGLLRAHVHIYERLHAFLHCKTATIDGVWSTVGSSNLDWWSIDRDDEINVIVLSHHFAKEMEVAFRHDREQSLAVTKAKWDDRPIVDRIREFCGWLVLRWL